MKRRLHPENSAILAPKKVGRPRAARPAFGKLKHEDKNWGKYLSRCRKAGVAPLPHPEWHEKHYGTPLA